MLYKRLKLYRAMDYVYRKINRMVGFLYRVGTFLTNNLKL